LSGVNNILIIQTAFIGDAILASSVIEELAAQRPQARLTLLVRKGNEGLFKEHPHLKEVFVWDKSQNKLTNLFGLLLQIRKNQFDAVINLQRFASTGILTAFSGAKMRIGFDKNPFAFAFTHKIGHRIHAHSETVHEIERNGALVHALTGQWLRKRPKLYPRTAQFDVAHKWINGTFITLSMHSVWQTKKANDSFWQQVVNAYPHLTVFFLGGPNERKATDAFIAKCEHTHAINLCGELSLLESAALMSSATMNFSNDSGPLHLCSAMNAPVTAVYCSTVPAFGFGPLSDRQRIIQTPLDLPCRPCGLHGHKSCPEGHFKCGDLNFVKVEVNP
jgi:ADP-heptose:LPS heptosyltransferase